MIRMTIDTAIEPKQGKSPFRRQAMGGNALWHSISLTVCLTKVPYSAAPGYWTKGQWYAARPRSRVKPSGGGRVRWHQVALLWNQKT